MGKNMNEPVAWISVLGIDHIGQKFTDVRISLTKTDVADIPLYTHPIKEKGLPLSSPSPMNQACLTSNDNYMTDDEIWAVASDYFAVKSHYVTEFARAILRKAQEK